MAVRGCPTCHGALRSRPWGEYCGVSCEFRGNGGTDPFCPHCDTQMTLATGAPTLTWTCHHCLLCEDCGRPFDECFDSRVMSWKTCPEAVA